MTTLRLGISVVLIAVLIVVARLTAYQNVPESAQGWWVLLIAVSVVLLCVASYNGDWND